MSVTILSVRNLEFPLNNFLCFHVFVNYANIAIQLLIFLPFSRVKPLLSIKLIRFIDAKYRTVMLFVMSSTHMAVLNKDPAFVN